MMIFQSSGLPSSLYSRFLSTFYYREPGTQTTRILFLNIYCYPYPLSVQYCIVTDDRLTDVYVVRFAFD